MKALLFAACGGAGVHLLFTRVAFGRRSLTTRTPRHFRSTGGAWLRQAGLRDVRWREFIAACSAVGVLAFLLAWAVFGGIVPGAIVGLTVAYVPVASHRQRRVRRIALSQDAWPRMIEEIRVLVTNTGLSIPQALFTVGKRAPADQATSFDVAQREWLLTTDFSRAIAVLKTELAHPSADITCETLLTAHHVGGVDLDRRLRDLAEDRLADVQARKDARAKQAGARFARAFVLVVPVGMALVGLSIGRGRVAYQSAIGQTLVACGLVMVAACWWWAGRIMTVPTEQRVFSQ